MTNRICGCPEHNAIRNISIPEIGCLAALPPSYFDHDRAGMTYPHVKLAGCATAVAGSMVSIKGFGFAGFMLACSTLLAAALSLGQVRAEGIRLDALQIPAEITGVSGRGPLQLEAIVVRPDDGQPHPLAVINHGSPRDAEDRPKMSPYGRWAEAVAFARRGWVAVAFLRRGYGRSQGE